jgi:hypothetical protein
LSCALALTTSQKTPSLLHLPIPSLPAQPPTLKTQRTPMQPLSLRSSSAPLPQVWLASSWLPGLCKRWKPVNEGALVM